MWDTELGREVLALEDTQPTRVTRLSADGKHWLTVDRAHHVVHRGRYAPLAERRNLPDPLRGHTGDITSVQYSPDPDGRFVLTTSADKTARLWETATGLELMTLKGHELDVLAADFSPDGRHVATGSADGTVRFWNIAPRNDYGQRFDERGPRAGPRAADRQQRAISAAALSPDGRRLATGHFDGTLRLFDAANSKQLVATRPFAELGDDLRDEVAGDIASLMWTADGKRLLTLSADSLSRTQDGKTRTAILPYNPVRIYDGVIGALQTALGGTHQGVRFAHLSPDGARVLTVADSMYNYVTYDNAGRFIGHGRGGNANDRTARIWDARTGKALHTLMGDWLEILSAAWDSKSQRIATVHSNSTVRIWDAQTGRETLRITDRAPALDSSSFTAAAFSPDGRHLQTWDDDAIRPNSYYGRPRQARVWDLTTGKRVLALKDSSGFAAYSPDGRWIVTTGYVSNSHSSGRSVGLHGRTADTLFGDRTARLWDAQRGKLHAVLKGHERSVHFAAFSKDSRLIVTASEDRTARVWSVATGKEIITLPGHEDAVKTAQFSGDAQTVLTVSWDGTARLWPIDPLPTALQRCPRALTAEERERFEVRQQP